MCVLTAYTYEVTYHIVILSYSLRLNGTATAQLYLY